MTSRSSWVALASTTSQSTAAPSAIDSASAISAPVSALLTTHFLGQPNQRAADSHARGVGRRLAERARHFLIAAVHLHARDDRFALFRPQPAERRFVPFERLGANRVLERRGGGVGGVVVQYFRDRR